MPKQKSTTAIGRLGEELAEKALRAQGYEIVARNWRCTAGEIDIVAKDGEVWVFVEVKLRRSAKFGAPEEAVTPRKQARLLESGTLYMHEQALDEAYWRIDIVAIELSPAGEVQRLTIHQDTVRAEG